VALRPYLLAVMRERREAAGVTLRQIEETAGRDYDRSNLSRVERGLAGTHQLAVFDRLLDAYAERLGVRPQDLWRDALERWEEAEASGVETARKRGVEAVERHARRSKPGRA
jgi:hypothetical protein